METVSSLPHTLMPATCPYPETDRSTKPPKSHLLEFNLNIIPPSTPGSPKWSPSLWPTQQNPVYTTPHTRYMSHALHFLHFITWTISGQQYRSLSSSLCSFLHTPVTSSFLGHNILLSTLFSFLPQCQRPSFIPIQNKRQYYSSVYHNH